MAEQSLLKDSLNNASIREIALQINSVYKDFDKKYFCELSENGLLDLELKARVQHIIQAMLKTLPADFKLTSTILLALAENWRSEKLEKSDTIGAYTAWPLIDYIAIAGIDHPKESLQCIEKLTPLFSAEFAIRAFIEAHPTLTLKKCKSWLNHPNEHVRRLVSEGTRPRLPWGKQLVEFIVDPSPILPLLKALNSDDSLYVRRSVANNLNDISKDHPELVIATCLDWQEQHRSSEHKVKVDWIIRHATRSLVKQGHEKIFALLGYTENPELKVHSLTVDKPIIKMGSSLEFELKIESLKNQKCVVDFAIYFVKANGRSSAKVFKLKNCDLKKSEYLSIRKKISFKAISTRKYYPGPHEIAILINGVEQIRCGFDLR